MTPRLDASPLSPEQQETMSEFAVPIGAAMQVLDPRSPAIYHVNLLPASVREGQRVFKLAWHGYALLLALFLIDLPVHLADHVEVDGRSRN